MRSPHKHIHVSVSHYHRSTKLNTPKHVLKIEGDEKKRETLGIWAGFRLGDCLNHPEIILPALPPYPGLWKNCLLQNPSLVPKRLGTADLKVILENVFSIYGVIKVDTIPSWALSKFH